MPSEQAAAVVLLPSGTRIDAKVFPLSGPFRRVRGLSLYQLEPGFLEALSSATGVIVEVEGRKIVEVAVPGAAAAVKMLRTCNDSLLEAMGVDPNLLASLRKRPVPVGGNVAQWVSHDDYPAEALRRRASGTSVVRLTIGTDGRVRNCAVAATSGDASLDRTTCSILLRRGRFEPAIGADGDPVEAPVVTSLRWWTGG